MNRRTAFALASLLALAMEPGGALAQNSCGADDHVVRVGPGADSCSEANNASAAARSWEAQGVPNPWHLRAGGGAHGIMS